MMKHYLFVEMTEGETFLVGANSLIEARKIATRQFGKHCQFQGILDEQTAEDSGLDEF